jgi:hypothetical protein
MEDYSAKVNELEGKNFYLKKESDRLRGEI